MTPVLMIVAVLVTAGGVVAVGAASPRLAAIGLAIALLGSCLVADPLPGLVAMLARLAGAGLTAYLCWIALRRAPGSLPTASLEWPGAAAIAVVALTAGFLAAGSLGDALAAGPADGPGLGAAGAALAGGSLVARAALGAAVALGAVAASPVVLARDTIRMGTGLLLLLVAASLVRSAFANGEDAVLELGASAAIALAGAAVSAVVAASLGRSGDVTLRETLRRDPSVRHRAPDDAHRPPERRERRLRPAHDAETHRPATGDVGLEASPVEDAG